jgi:hypothetical protein
VSHQIIKDRCWDYNGVTPNQVFSKKQVFIPLPMMKKPRSKNSLSTPMCPFQKGEHMGLTYIVYFGIYSVILPPFQDISCIVFLGEILEYRMYCVAPFIWTFFSWFDYLFLSYAKSSKIWCNFSISCLFFISMLKTTQLTSRNEVYTSKLAL